MPGSEGRLCGRRRHRCGLDSSPQFHDPVADVIFGILAFLMLGFYLALMTQPSPAGAQEG